MKIINYYYFQIIDQSKAIKITQNEIEEGLIEIGEGDILIRKLGNKYVCSCNKHSFNYFDNNLIPNDITIEIKHLYVYEMIDFNLLQYQIEEITQKKMKRIIFDSKIHNWKIGKSEFDKKIWNKENLVFLIETDKNILFGGFISSKIDKIYIEKPTEYKSIKNEKHFYLQ